MGNFDPYLAWLDIPNDQRPATLYRLLGIRQFENDPQVIASAADRVLNHLMQFQQSAHASECGRLMQEVLAAKACLLEPGQKAQYDETLKRGQPTGTAGNLGMAGQDSNMFPPARAGQEQQIGQAPPVPGSAPPSAGGPERKIAGTPPVPGAASQERKLAPPTTGPGPSPGGEKRLRPPPGLPSGGPGGAGPSPALPSGQQIASPGLPKPSGPTGPSLPVPGPVGGATEQPLSSPAAPGAGVPGSSPGSPPSRPMPRGTGQPSAGPGGPAPTVPVGPGGPAAGGQPGGAPYMPPGPAGAAQPGAPGGASPDYPMQPGSVPLPQMGPGMNAPGPVPGQTRAPLGPAGQPAYGQTPMQPGQGYPAAPIADIPTAMPAMPPTASPAGPPAQPPQPQGGRPSWAPERRTGQVGQSVANVVAGQKGSRETTNYADRDGRKARTRRKSSATYQAMVIVLAGAILLFGFILALMIARYLM